LAHQLLEVIMQREALILQVPFAECIDD